MASPNFNSFRTATGRLAVLVAGVLAGSAGLAQAALPAAGVPSVTVSFGDLNLASPQDVRTLYMRIQAAARQVCPLQSPVDSAAALSAHACRDAAVARAIHDINIPRLPSVQATLQAEHAKRG